MSKRKTIAIACGILLTGPNLAHADKINETVEFNATWNHGYDFKNISKSSYSDLEKLGRFKKTKASIGNKSNCSEAERDVQWCRAKQSGE